METFLLKPQTQTITAKVPRFLDLGEKTLSKKYGFISVVSLLRESSSELPLDVFNC